MFGAKRQSVSEVPPRYVDERDIEEIRYEIAAVRSDLAQIIEQQKQFPIHGIASLIEKSFEHRPESDLYEALMGGSNSVRGHAAKLGLKSSVCKQLHFALDEFRYWTNAMGRRPRFHRKEWEWFYVAQAIFEHDMLQPGKRGLGFAVGREPLPSLFATFGCDILATDQGVERAAQSGWSATDMYAGEVEALRHANIIERDPFMARVGYEPIDMNDIPDHLAGQFDFCWSSCSFEHLGSLEQGLRFVENSVKTLKPGGVAVHTTEFNLQSNESTWETPGDSLYRRCDIEDLIRRLEGAGHAVAPVDWAMGNGFVETVSDTPPYKQSPHLKLNIAGYDCTSIGIIIRKKV